MNVHPLHLHQLNIRITLSQILKKVTSYYHSIKNDRINVANARTTKS